MGNARLIAAVVLLCGLLVSARATAHDGEIVKGHNFEGVIFTPQMLDQNAYPSFFSDRGGLWTPSRTLVNQAEAALPAALAEKTRYPKPVRGPNFPRYFTPKSAMRPDFNDAPRLTGNTEDSIMESNFLYSIASYYHEQKRQYIGVTVKGKRLLLLSFAYGPGLIHDPTFDQWKHLWIEVLDGGDNFWRVLYDPATGKFSGWECNGYA